MAATFMNAELDPSLAAIVNALTGSGINMHLYSNNHIPTPADTLANYTEANYSTYAAVNTGLWSAASGGSTGVSQSGGGGCLFSPGVLGTPQDCYGWYLTDVAGNLLGADVFTPGPLNLGGTTPAVLITPFLSLS